MSEDKYKNALMQAYEILKETPELNMVNYTDDDVAKLNDGTVQAWLVITDAIRDLI